MHRIEAADAYSDDYERCSDVGSAKHEPPCVVPEVGQGSEYGAKCPQRRLGWVVSQTPRAEFHVAREAGGAT